MGLGSEGSSVGDPSGAVTGGAAIGAIGAGKGAATGGGRQRSRSPSVSNYRPDSKKGKGKEREREREREDDKSQVRLLKGDTKSKAGDEKTDGNGNGKRNLFKILDTHTNIAPIVDACLVDRDGDKEVSPLPPFLFRIWALNLNGIDLVVQIVTASGGRNTGSLRIVKHGADFQVLATVEDVPGVVRMWSLKRWVKTG